jgi:hypothetical protein
MKTININLKNDYSRLSNLIYKRGVKHSGHNYNSTLYITETHKYVFDLNNETLTISHFDYWHSKTVNG